MVCTLVDVFVCGTSPLIVDVCHSLMCLCISLVLFSKLSTAVDCFLLSCMLPLGTELLEALNGNSNLTSNFKHYFNGLVLLAGMSKNEGHLSLVSSVTGWLNLCAGCVGKKQAKLEEKQDSLVPATYLLQYLAQLTTAVQFSTNRARCSERIALANEGDVLVQVSSLQSVSVVLDTVRACDVRGGWSWGGRRGVWPWVGDGGRGGWPYSVVDLARFPRDQHVMRLLNPNIDLARAKMLPSHSPCLSI